MNISSISLRDLEYVVSAGTLLHFGRAAQACHVSQPALSLQIRKIEDQLGVALFERTGRKVLLTPIGERVVAQARNVLHEATKIFEVCSSEQAPFREPFRIASIATLGPYLLPIVLGPLVKKYPAGKFLFSEGLTEPLLESLKKGETDVVLLADTFDKSQVEWIPLFFEPFYLAVAKGHELATKKPLVSKDLHSEHMVLLEDGHCLVDQALAICSRGKSRGRQPFHATSMETLRHLVASGMGYTLFPALASEGKGNLKEMIAYRPFSHPVGRKIGLAYRKGFSRAMEAESLAKLITAHIGGTNCRPS
jgi:LysR family transcriptional regulator, hydrogen peroxide-inducible genes activator